MTRQYFVKALGDWRAGLKKSIFNRCYKFWKRELAFGTDDEVVKKLARESMELSLCGHLWLHDIL